MTSRIMAGLFVILSSCVSNVNTGKDSFSSVDSIDIQEMVDQREKAMINRDINSVTQQFDTNANFINGGGFIYEGLTEIKNFHNSMFTNDSLTYTYKIGKAFINPIQASVAIIYYPWQQNWTLKNVKSDTLKETGLMTIVAIKQEGKWKWKSVTNQRTKEYFDDLKEHKSEAIQ